MPETTPTITVAAAQTLTDLKAGILDAVDDAILDAYAIGRDAGLTEQQAKHDAVAAERARGTNHLYGLLQAKDAELVRTLVHANRRIAELNRDLAAHGKLVKDGDRCIAELHRDLAATKAMANDLDDKHSAAMWDLAELRSRVAQLEHDLRVSQANHATEREHLVTEIRNHQKTRAELATVRSCPVGDPAVGAKPTVGGPPTVGGERPAHRPGEVVYVHTTGAGGYLQIKGDTPANNRRLSNLRPWDIAAVEFPVGHIVWASSPAVLGEVRRLFHSK